MYYHVITASYANATMNYFCFGEEVLLIPWGIIPILKGLRFERVHMEGNIIFIDNRKLQMSLVVRQFVYQHVYISARIQWLGPIILPRGLYLLSIVMAKRNLTVSIIL